MKAKSIKGKSPEEITSFLSACISDGFKPTLAFVFISIEQDRKPIISILDKEEIAIFGATTVGEFTEGGVDTGSIVLLLLDINPDTFKIAIRDHTDGSAINSGRYIGNVGLAAYDQPAFIISGSNINTPGEFIMKGLLEVVDEKTAVMGGMAGDDNQSSRSCVFTNNQESYQGVLALIIDEKKITLAGEAVSGWKAAGTEKTITQCEGPWIQTIDDKPAMQVIKKYTGIEINDSEHGLGLLHAETTFPIQIQQERGGPVMRPLLFYNPKDDSIMCGGSVSKGSRFHFSLPPDFEVVDSVIASAKEIRKNILSDADAVLIFSCIGRHVSLGPLASSEVLGIQQIWEKPMAGFFSMGEFGKVKDGNTQFHGTTISWVALKEK
ncbi:MAG: FIST C-terminal domain-containing protein [Bacteroidetes bacterium]|nr:FIST C-terminal domain-containing protein [Bacteroidota bacterium]